jgi:tripartite-type tricarboxylate transporter receptor subunit TctC|tara:strand:+ start:2311 stop:3147 length:837 start_codon:yes stop_codon:yes gene_type:complete
MLKIILTSALAGLISISIGYADNKVDVVQYSKPGGQADRMVTYVQDSLGDNFGQRIVVDSCAAAKKVLMNTDNPTVVAWMTELNSPQSDGSPNPCKLDDNMFIGYLAASPWSICHRTDNADATIDALTSEKIRVGVWRSAHYNKKFNDFLVAMNPDAKMIPYKKGSEYRAALAAGELDFTITTMGKDGEICPIVFSATTEDSVQATMVASQIAPDAPNTEMTYNYTLWGVNMDSVNMDLISEVHASEGWKNRRDNRFFPYLATSSVEVQFNHMMGIEE